MKSNLTSTFFVCLCVTAYKISRGFGAFGINMVDLKKSGLMDQSITVYALQSFLK